MRNSDAEANLVPEAASGCRQSSDGPTQFVPLSLQALIDPGGGVSGDGNAARVGAFSKQFAPWLSGEAGAGFLKPAPNDYLRRWPVSKRVNSSKADADDPTLIEPVQLATA